MIMQNLGGQTKSIMVFSKMAYGLTKSQRQDISCLKLRELVTTNLVTFPAQGQFDSTDMFYLQTANLAYQFW